MSSTVMENHALLPMTAALGVIGESGRCGRGSHGRALVRRRNQRLRHLILFQSLLESDIPGDVKAHDAFWLAKSR